MKLSSLSIVVVAYNEAEALPPCLGRTLSFLREHVEDGEILVVDDGSNDETPRLIQGLADNHVNVEGIYLSENRGMGGALREGYQRAQKEWVTMLPADGQIDAYELKKFFPVTAEADVITSLYENRRYTLFRDLLSKGLRLLTRWIVGSSVPIEGTYFVRGEILHELTLVSNSFLLNLELPIRALRKGAKLRTISIRVSERLAGESKAVTLGRVFQTFVELFRLRARLRE